MGEEEKLSQAPEAPKSKGAKTKEEKQREHKKRIRRTLVACFLGIATGLLSFYICGTPDPATGLQQNQIIGILLLMAGVVVQKHIFMLMKIDYTELNNKDWFYQAFMTFAFWFISWSTMLTTSSM
ncbi:hypothetical protein [Methanofollis sp. UBA420]|jgi:hypothetical protein|uniref:EMC6-like membrane protein n=1 Tax=Methanofollis sp. UBA420 TaxID=1915514 RepID=UPI00316ACAEA